MEFQVITRCEEFCEDYQSGDRVMHTVKDPVEAIKLSAGQRNLSHTSWVLIVPA